MVGLLFGVKIMFEEDQHHDMIAKAGLAGALGVGARDGPDWRRQSKTTSNDATTHKITSYMSDAYLGINDD